MIYDGADIVEYTRATGRVIISVEDTDSDNMADSWEIMYFDNLSHDGTADSDNDGLTDLEEFQLLTNPIDPDSDDDGYNDGYEVEAGKDPIFDGSHPLGAMPWIPLLLLDDIKYQ